MKIGFFTDPHCGDTELCVGTRRPVLSLGKMQRALDLFRAQGAQLVICLGDLINGSGDLTEDTEYLHRCTETLRRGGLPFRVLLGNHDLYDFTGAYYYEQTGLSPLPLAEQAGDVTLIYLDACRLDDERAYFDDGKKPEWKRSYIDRRQREALTELLDRSPDDARFWVLTHQSLDPNCEKSHIILNAAEVREILTTHGRGRVERCICGHYHRGGADELDGIRYTVLPAMCNGEKTLPGALMILNTESDEEIRNAEPV